MAIRRNARGRPLRLLLADGCINVDIAVLAIGNLAPAVPFPAPRSRRVIADPWAPGALDNIGDGSPVIVAGTGLTMLDVAIAATSGHPGTAVHAVSRHGLLRASTRSRPQPAATSGCPPSATRARYG